MEISYSVRASRASSAAISSGCSPAIRQIMDDDEEEAKRPRIGFQQPGSYLSNPLSFPTAAATSFPLASIKSSNSAGVRVS